MQQSVHSNQSMVIVSNRLPIVLKRVSDSGWEAEPGSGGLVTAMAPVLKNRGGTWIGWPGNVFDENIEINSLLRKHDKSLGYQLKAINLSSQEIEDYYKGFANEIIWPLFHDFIAHCNFNPDYWIAYQKVNIKFAEITASNAQKDSFIWIHDYHLLGLATALRNMGISNKLAYFLHIPFPPPDIFIRLPWRSQILNALLDYDLIGFQTLRDRRNFLQCLRMFLKKVKISGKGQVMKIQHQQKEQRVGVFPISIDFNEFSKLADTREVSDRAWYIHEHYENRQILIGVDRMDYSKGIPERLKAFRRALQNYPDLIENITFVQVVVPSRREIAKYVDLKAEIEGLVGEINGEFTRSGWVPVHYMFTSLDRQELVAYYRTAEIAFITPLKDGMNLVAKEYCASNIEESGCLILSEFAGSAAQLQKNAIMVNPHDIDGMATAIHKAFHMSIEEKKIHMSKLRQLVKKNNIFRWVDNFLEAAIEKNLSNFPVLSDFVPSSEKEFYEEL